MTMAGNTAAHLDDFNGLLDWNGINAWARQASLPGEGPVLAVESLAGGSQNHLFRMRRAGGDFVLRRPPRHLREKSNETILREARVLSALAGSQVPHPTLYDVCDDSAVTGACFFAMAPLDGFSPLGELPGDYAVKADWRYEMGREFVRAAAALSQVDHVAVGLADFGKAERWHDRQVARWYGQLEGYRSMEGYDPQALPFVERVGRWLDDNIPADRRLGIIHGDLQWPNAMFSHGAPRILGLIDWELSTIGDPLLDMAWILTSWREAGDPVVGGKAGEPVVRPWQDFCSRDDMIGWYLEATGRDAQAVPWFFVLACYKLACLLEGTYARSMVGKASPEMGEFLHHYAIWLMHKADSLVRSL